MGEAVWVWAWSLFLAEPALSVFVLTFQRTGAQGPVYTVPALAAFNRHNRLTASALLSMSEARRGSPTGEFCAIFFCECMGRLRTIISVLNEKNFVASVQW